MHEDLTLRERTRRAVRSEIAEAALGLFLKQGFEPTTVEEIARAAGISRRSYFRYFSNKDETLVMALSSVGESIAAALHERPSDEPVWSALRRAFDPLIEHADSDPNAVALARLMLERPGLQQGKEAAWHTAIAAEIAPRLLAGDTSLGSRALAAAVIACLHAAQEQWLTPGEDRNLGTLLTQSMEAVRPLR